MRRLFLFVKKLFIYSRNKLSPIITIIRKKLVCICAAFNNRLEMKLKLEAADVLVSNNDATAAMRSFKRVISEGSDNAVRV